MSIPLHVQAHSVSTLLESLDEARRGDDEDLQAELLSMAREAATALHAALRPSPAVAARRYVATILPFPARPADSTENTGLVAAGG